MIELVAAAAPAAPDPGLPYQAIGVVLAALIAGVTGIVVALLQRNKPATPAPPPDPTPAPTFVVPEAEWITVRDRSLRTETLLQDLKEDYLRHEGSSNRNMLRLIEELRNVKGRQGSQ